MKVLVTGSQGMLGTDLCSLAPDDVTLTRVDVRGGDATVDITDPVTVHALIDGVRPQAVIHCAAYTDVDQSEREPREAFRINGLGTRNVAQACQAAGAALCYISTDFVFDGELGRPYHEFDTPHPISTYGASKLAGEQAVRELCCRHWIVRTAWLFGLNGRSFPATMLRAARSGRQLRVVADQTGSPTFTVDLARSIWRLIRRPEFGVHHVVNAGDATWYDLACRTLDRAGIGAAAVTPIPASDWPSPARRPRFSPLDTLSTSANGPARMRTWQEALDEFVDALVRNDHA